MKPTVRIIPLSLAAIGLSTWLAGSATAQAARQAPPATPENVGYAVGHELGGFVLERLELDGVDADVDALLEGFEDALREREGRLDRDEVQAILRDLEKRVAARRAEELRSEDPVFEAAAEANLRRSRAFHEAFGQEEGVTTLPSGVQYRVLESGEGTPADWDDTVVVSFEGTLLDGYEFADRERAEFVVGDVLEGARDVLMRMRPGARWKVAIPPDLAYGPAGRVPDVGPNETLLFDVTLHEIKGDR